MIKLLKLVVVNILVFLGLLIFLNLTVISIDHLPNFRFFTHTHKIKKEGKWRLPNYKNIEWARKHFEEFKELPTEYVSYIGWRRLPYKGQTINIDEQGIRNTPQSELASEKSPLVVFLGGSTMWGTGSNDSNTIPAFFAKIAHGRYRAMNLGESGYTAFQGYLFLNLQMINGLKPNVVVSYVGVNDAAILPEGRPFSHSRENQIRTVMKGQDRIKEETLSFSHFFLNPLKSFIAKHKRKEKHKGINAKNGTYDISQERVEQMAKALLESLLCTKELAETHGAYFFAVLQPNAGIGKPYLRHLKLEQDMLNRYKLFYPVFLKLLQTPKYQELYNNVIVLTDAFDLEEYIYIDHCHVSPNGNKIIAEKIYNHITNFIDNKKKE